MSLRIVFLDRDTLRKDITIRKPDFDHEWINYDQTQASQIVDRLSQADIAITNKVPLNGDTLAKLPRLKMIGVAATGVDMIDLPTCHQQRLVVSNIRDYALTTVPEHVIGLMLTLRRQILRYREQVIQGRWQREGRFCFYDAPIYHLAKAKLGIIGYGSLGQATARLANAFGAQIQYYSRKAKPGTMGNFVDLDTLLKTSDIISCHCPLTPETHHLINAHTLSQMPRHAILINTSRGAIVDEQALAQAIQNQTLAGAGIDVLSQEPPPLNSPLMKLASQSNVILTPHIAWASQEAMQCLADQLIDNIEHFVAGHPRHTL